MVNDEMDIELGCNEIIDAPMTRIEMVRSMESLAHVYRASNEAIAIAITILDHLFKIGLSDELFSANRNGDGVAYGCLMIGIKFYDDNHYVLAWKKNEPSSFKRAAICEPLILADIDYDVAPFYFRSIHHQFFAMVSDGDGNVPGLSSSNRFLVLQNMLAIYRLIGTDQNLQWLEAMGVPSGVKKILENCTTTNGVEKHIATVLTKFVTVN